MRASPCHRRYTLRGTKVLRRVAFPGVSGGGGEAARFSLRLPARPPANRSSEPSHEPRRFSAYRRRIASEPGGTREVGILERRPPACGESEPFLRGLPSRALSRTCRRRGARAGMTTVWTRPAGLSTDSCAARRQFFRMAERPRISRVLTRSERRRERLFCGMSEGAGERPRRGGSAALATRVSRPQLAGAGSAGARRRARERGRARIRSRRPARRAGRCRPRRPAARRGSRSGNPGRCAPPSRGCRRPR